MLICERLFEYELKARGLLCWLIGYDEIDVYRWEDPYCDRCLAVYPMDLITLPDLLNRAYCWAVDHGFPYKLDLWLQKHFRLPSWWEY
jgi:hypothetical protein